MSEPQPPQPASPWQTIWLHPTQTMHTLLSSPERDYWATPLLVGSSILAALTPQMRELLLSLFPQLGAQNVQSAALGLGLLSGALQATCWPLLLSWGARLLGARLEAQVPPQAQGRSWAYPALLAAGWSTLPLIVGCFLAPLASNSLSSSDESGAALGIVNVLLSLWSMLLLAHMLAAGYGLDTLRGALSTILAGVFGFVGLGIVSLLLSLLLVGLKH